MRRLGKRRGKVTDKCLICLTCGTELKLGDEVYLTGIVEDIKKMPICLKCIKRAHTEGYEILDKLYEERHGKKWCKEE